MARRGLHKFVSAIGEVVDTTLVRSTDWNADTVMAEELQNRTGGTINPGDVVAADSANNESVIQVDTLNAVRLFYVTLGKLSNRSLVAINNLELGLFSNQGAYPTLVNGPVTRLNYLIKSATSKALQDSGVSSTTSNPPTGALAVALANNGAGTATITAQWLGVATAGVVFGTGGITDPGLAQSDGSANSSPRYDHVHRFRAPNTTLAGLPAAGTSGRIARLTDNIRGLFIDDGSAWIHMHGKILDAKRDFGAKGDGTTDDTTAIQTALNNATDGTVYLPPGNYKISSTLTMGDGTISTDSTYHYPKLIGAGGATGLHAISYPAGSTRLSWFGAGGGTMISVRGPIWGPEIRDIGIDGRSIAGIGVQLDSCIRTHMSGVTIVNVTSIGLNLTTQLGASNIGHFCERGQFHRITIYPTEANNSAEGIRMHAAGGTGTGVFGNAFYDCLVRCQHSSQKALRLGLADHNIFYHFVAAGGTGAAVVLDNTLAGTGANTYPANNVFFVPVLTGGISSVGSQMPLNHFILYTTRDSQPDPGNGNGFIINDLWALMGPNVGLKFRQVTNNPSAPPDNEARIFSRAKTGSPTKTELCAQFPDGTIVILAQEP